MFLIAKIENGFIVEIVPVQLRFPELGDSLPSEDLLNINSYLNVIEDEYVDSLNFTKIVVEPYIKDNKVYTYTLVEKSVEEKHIDRVKRVESCKQEILTFTQEYLDDFAKTKHYDSILSVISYLDSTVEEYRNDAMRCRDLRDSIWAITVDTITKIDFRMEHIEDFKILLPKLTWNN